MAEQVEIAPYYDPIDDTKLEVYQLPGDEDPQPTILLEADGVQTTSPVANSDETRQYVVEAEFKPGYHGLLDHSFQRYLWTFEDAKISQEVLAGTIRHDLMRALDLDDVFVSVMREAAHKSVHLGAP